MSGEVYLWVKSFHLITVIFWMAGLFMLPRYFAYHAEEMVGSDQDQKWQDRERRLLRIIMNPAMIVAWVLGLVLIWYQIGLAGGFGDVGGWLHVKLVFVIALTVFHMVLARWRKTFAAGQNTRTTKFYRLVNEIPSLGIILVVILAIVKPF